MPNMLEATMFLAVLSRTEPPVPLLLKVRRLPLSSLALVRTTTDMVLSCHPVLERTVLTVKAKVLADVGTTTATPAMLVRLLNRWMARDS
nr:MAG TPA: Forkhead box M1 factor, Cell cycle, negative [Caudoviricetes sp.]